MILDGKAVSKKILDSLKVKVGNLSKQPHLVVILVGNNPASQIYVKNKKLAAENIGIKSTIIELFMCKYPEVNYVSFYFAWK